MNFRGLSELPKLLPVALLATSLSLFTEALADDSEFEFDEPTGAEFAPEPSAQQTISTERDPDVPMYTYSRPNWAFGIAGTLRAFGRDLDYNQSQKAMGFTFRFEYQPEFIQRIGVVSIGPSLSLYPTQPVRRDPSDELEPLPPRTATDRFGNWSVGGQIQYQARFVREQIIVPTVGYAFEYLKYNPRTIGSFQVLAHGYTLGGMFLLNALDSAAAAEAYVNWGISRSYLFVEIRSLSGNTKSNLQNDLHAQQSPLYFRGKTVFGGLRVEL